MLTKVAEYDILFNHIYGSFCKAYCYTMPFDAYQKLSSTLSHVLEWVREKQLSENGGENGPYIKATIPSVVNTIIEGFEGSKEYAEIRKNFGVTYRDLIKMDSVLLSELEAEYQKPKVALRGGYEDQGSGTVPCSSVNARE